MQNFGSSESFGAFMKGYRQQEQKPWNQGKAPDVSAFDILDLFAAWEVSTMTSLEIASQLMITPQDTLKFITELEKRELVTSSKSPEGTLLVEITKRGKKFIA